MKKQTHASHEVELENGDVAYIKMPRLEGDKKVAKSMRLYDLVAGYKGADIMLDFSEDDELLGIEVLAF